jgi:hypothetical protein
VTNLFRPILRDLKLLLCWIENDFSAGAGDGLLLEKPLSAAKIEASLQCHRLKFDAPWGKAQAGQWRDPTPGQTNFRLDLAAVARPRET